MSGENSEMGSAHIKTAGNLVAAYVSNNHIAPSDLTELIASVPHRNQRLATGGSLSAGNAEHDPEKPTSAKVRKSVRPDALISFIDGKPYSTLKRHLAKHGFNPTVTGLSMAFRRLSDGIAILQREAFRHGEEHRLRNAHRPEREG